MSYRPTVLYDLEHVDDRNPVRGVLDLVDELLLIVVALDRWIAEARPQNDRDRRQDERAPVRRSSRGDIITPLFR
jgi:hypothetical protein